MPNKRTNRRKKNKEKSKKYAKAAKLKVDDVEKLIETLNRDGICKEMKKFIVYAAERQVYGPDKSNEFIIFCLSSYFILQERYYDLCHVYNLLPLEIMEEQIFSDYHFKAGVNDQLIQLINIKIEHHAPGTKVAVLVMDETSIQPSSSYISSIRDTVGFVDNGKTKDINKLAKCITNMWMQALDGRWVIPVGFIFTENSASVSDIKDFLFECVTKLTNIGVDIVGVVTKMRTNFYELATELNISPSNQTFKVGDYELVFLFDVPQLMNITRNNLLKYKLKFDDMQTSWKDITAFYQLKKENLKEERTKLTDLHVKPDFYTRSIPKFAIELLSNTVATEMRSFVHLGKLPESAIGTAECIDLFDKLFDILNSHNEVCINEFNSAFKGSKHQNKFIAKVVDFFENLEVYNTKDEDCTDDLKFTKGWLITIKGAMKIWDIIKAKGHPYLLTRNISCESLDKFIAVIKEGFFPLQMPTIPVFLDMFARFFNTAYFVNNGPPLMEFHDFDLEDFSKKVYKRIPQVKHNLDNELNDPPEDCSIFTDMFEQLIQNFFFILE